MTKTGSWIIGATNSSCYFAAALLGVWTIDPLNERYGRRGALFFAAVLNFASALGAAVSQTWWQVLLCRVFTGVAMVEIYLPSCAVQAHSLALGNQSRRGTSAGCRSVAGIDSGFRGDGFLADMCSSRACSV